MDFNFLPKTLNQQIFLPELESKNIQLFIKREDQIDPFVSGNKFRKLKYNLKKAHLENKQIILTFGGAFSNHILATAVAGEKEGFLTVGVIRGDELGVDFDKTLETNPTLRKAFDHGMQFEFVTREQYRNKSDVLFLEKLKVKYGDFYFVPEGGTNELAVEGCEEILTEEDNQFDYICCCVGTGGTIAGLIRSIGDHQKVLGFPSLKGDFLEDEIRQYINSDERWKLLKDYHFGGYGKYNLELIHFINCFKEETKIPLDPIYTGKMMFGVLDLVTKEKFPTGSKILAIHTGGLQGIEGFNNRLSKKSDIKIYT